MGIMRFYPQVKRNIINRTHHKNMKKFIAIVLMLNLVFNLGSSLSSQELKQHVEYNPYDFESYDYENRIANIQKLQSNHSLFNVSGADGKSVLCNMPAADDYDGGNGTAEDPYQIATPEHMLLLAQQTNEGTGGDAYYILTNDIDLEGNLGFIWTPIGNFNNPFTGSFDGNNHTISNMHATDPLFAGLFGYIHEATIKNLKMADAYVYFFEPNYELIAGIIAGLASNSNFYDCETGGELSAIAWEAGGIVGRFASDTESNDTVFIKNCINRASLFAINCLGGIAGISDSKNNNILIQYCENYGEVEGGIAGGITGDGEGYIIRNCDNYAKIGNIENNIAAAAGGIAGQGGHNVVIIEDCLNHETGEIVGGSAGGIIGAPQEAVMRRCGNRALIKAMHVNTLLAGGISGSDGSFFDCYNIGDVTVFPSDGSASTGQYGGITGSPTDGKIHNVYNAGKIIQPSSHISNELFSHIIPALLSDDAIINCYWTYNEDISDKVFSLEASAYIELPESSRFKAGSTPTSWTLDNPQYNTTDMLEALNAGAEYNCIWIEDTEGVNGGFPIAKKIGFDFVEENQNIKNQLTSVYPNPGQNFLNIETVLRNVELNVYDIQGRLIHSQIITDNTTQINTSSWANGMYIWELKTDNNEQILERGKWVK